MYSLHLRCTPEESELLSAELWERGTVGIRELDYGESTVLVAAFETNDARADLLRQFLQYSPEWEQEDATDWVEATHEAWPARAVGERVFLAPPWSNEPTPPHRVRVIHNPGLACGTGEHPCTQMALLALEECLAPGDRVVDIGTGSAILAIAALRLGAGLAAGADLDEAALQAARENFQLNGLDPLLVVGSADAFADASADVVIANISGTVLLSILDDLVRIVRSGGHLILTGFTEYELPAFQSIWPEGKVLALNEWRCLMTYDSAS
jgi:ribosomal protein L11 methyltransferase